MKYKRTNWSTEEVLQMLDGQKILNGNWEEDEHCKEFNSMIDDVKDHFYDFLRPLTEWGALGKGEDGAIYHIGGIPEEAVREWEKEHVIDA